MTQTPGSMHHLIEFYGDPISTYTRADALADGTLVALDEKLSREAGIRIPVAVTRRVWAECIEWADADDTHTRAYQDQAGRLWDVVWMTAHAMRRHASAMRAPVTLHVVPRNHPDGDHYPQEIHLTATLSGGDNGEPVVTIGFPDED